jgi:hypothetical protein
LTFSRDQFLDRERAVVDRQRGAAAAGDIRGGRGLLDVIDLDQQPPVARFREGGSEGASKAW